MNLLLAGIMITSPVAAPENAVPVADELPATTQWTPIASPPAEPPPPTAAEVHAELADAAPPARPDPPVPPRLVVTNTYGLNFGMIRIPSAEITLFLGRSLPRQMQHPRHWLAVGLQNSVSVGYADGGLGPYTDGGDRRGFVSYRPLVMVQGVSGRAGYLHYAGGLGPVFYLARQWDDHDRNEPIGVGLDVEGRLGLVFTRHSPSRIQGVLGGQLRLSGVFNGSPVPQPLPQFGLFVGFTRVPTAPTPSALDATGRPRDGRRALIAGGVLLAASVPLIIAGSILWVGGALSEGPSSGADGFTYPVFGLGVASLVASIPTLIVGAKRRRAWRTP